jgi:hypothetical protein
MSISPLPLSNRLRVMASPYGSSRSHVHPPHSVGLLWTSDQPDTKTSIWQHKTPTWEKFHAPAGFEPTIPASGQPQTHALDRAVTGIDWMSKCLNLFLTSASPKLHYTVFTSRELGPRTDYIAKNIFQLRDALKTNRYSSIRHNHVFFYSGMTHCFLKCSSSGHHYINFKIRYTIVQIG